MKKINLHLKTFRLTIVTCIITLLMAGMNGSIAQDNTGAKPAVTQKKKAIKNSFEGLYILDNQTVMVPIKGTFEMDIQHRFGIVSNGYKDLYGLGPKAQYIYMDSGARTSCTYLLHTR